MSNLSETLRRLKAQGSKAMGLFLTSGFPSPQETLPILQALDAGGADFLELGMPFSDPLAEGLPIQRSSARALGHGVCMDDTFRIAAAFRAHSATPLVLMGYINPILRYGIGNFCHAAHSSGVDGLIVPDLPLEEGTLLEGRARTAGLDLIYLMAPNSPDARVRRIDAQSSGFVYAVSVTGVTGSGLEHRMQAVERYLERARSLVRRNPIMVGFGIKTRADAERLCQYADGFIVGSALVGLIEGLWGDESLSAAARLKAVQDYARALSPDGDA